ncbi:MAG: hypothetical protein QF782_05710, partial [Porticoccaceae bacterium]|nr:hypothetical protein [Porticoccaceae bacterium]
ATITSSAPIPPERKDYSEELYADEVKKLVVLADSNSKRLDKRKFCHPIKQHETRWEVCYRIEDVNNQLDAMQNMCINTIVISCGTNDIDSKSGVEVAQDIIKMVQRVKTEHPESMIVVSETTPRKHQRDDQIKVCNKLLNENLNLYENVTVASQSNLRDATFSMHEDDKHVKKNKIHVYAGNLKGAMRRLRDARDAKRSDRQSSTANTSAPAHNTQQQPPLTTDHVRPLMSVSVSPPIWSQSSHPTTTSSSNGYPTMAPTSVSVAPHPSQPAKTTATNIPVRPGAPPFLPSIRGCAACPTMTSTSTFVASHSSQQETSTQGIRPAPPGVRPSPPSTDNVIPIGTRLRKISESSVRHHDKDLRETMIEKLGDMIRCLQVW